MLHPSHGPMPGMLATWGCTGHEGPLSPCRRPQRSLHNKQYERMKEEAQKLQMVKELLQRVNNLQPHGGRR